MVVPVVRALLFGVCIRAPDCWNLLYVVVSSLKGLWKTYSHLGYRWKPPSSEQPLCHSIHSTAPELGRRRPPQKKGPLKVPLGATFLAAALVHGRLSFQSKSAASSPTKDLTSTTGRGYPAAQAAPEPPVISRTALLELFQKHR